MSETNNAATICKSIFQNGECTTTEQKFTEIMIKLINKLENNK